MADPTRVDDWWRHAVLYQIYPRSFFDANGDGVGDLAGIVRKLDHVASLGVDVVWLSPFFPSPMRDFGYDIADHCAVHPLFGTLADFDALIARAQVLGLKVIVDLVPSHTSDQHPWFIESRTGCNNPKADWYVWADPKPDGTPPNNWLSIFGGSAWQWDSGRRQYYLHNFLVAQPDLNVHNPAVVEALLAIARFWLDRGVAGFRIDALNFLTHDPALRDNPPRGPGDPPASGIHPSNPYGMQVHRFDRSQPATLPVLERFRAVLERYPGSLSVAEVADDTPATAASYVAEGRLHMAYSFDLLGDQATAGQIRHVVETTRAHFGDGWPCWALSNHDCVRVVSRWSGTPPGMTPPPGFARLAMALLLTLPGTPCLYQGEELGLPEADIPFEQRQDPYGLAFWPAFRGRDGCRTPMPWHSAVVNLGFSTGTPWLPVPPLHAAHAVDRQEQNRDSQLAFTRALIAFRRTEPALHSVACRFRAEPEPVLAYERGPVDGPVLLCVFNLSPEPQLWDSRGGGFVAIGLPGLVGPAADGSLALPGYGVAIGWLHQPAEAR